jgi:hypothetical protein
MPISPSVNHPIDCGLATTTEFSRQFAKQTVANRSVDISTSPSMRGIDSFVGVSSETIGDVVWSKETFDVSVSDCDVSIIGRGYPYEVRSVKSLNTGILANPSSVNPLKLAYQSNGRTSVEVELSNGERHADGFQTYTQSQAPVYTFQNHINGTLSKHILDQFLSIADGSTSSPSHYQVYSTFDFTNNVYVKNNGFWASDLNFSGVSVNKQGSGGVTSVVMVTPRHAIGAAHYAPPADPNGGPIIGDKMYFCDENNNTVERTVVAAQNTLADARIVKFDSDVPSTVKKYKLFPANWKNYLPQDFFPNVHPISNAQFTGSGARVPFIAMSHFRWDEAWPLQRPNRYAYIYVGSIPWSTFSNGSIAKATMNGGPATSSFGGVFNDYNGEPSGIRGGDSGLPCFYIVNGDLIFSMKHLYPAAGSFLPDFLTEIQNTINFVGSEGYSLQSVNLSGFTYFSS